MTAFDVEVANRAINAVGARGQIASVNENSNEARYVRAYYETTLKAMLRAAHWNFARKYGYLTQLKAAPGAVGNTAPGTGVWVPASQPPPPWMYEYAYPADCLAMRFLSPLVATGAFQGTPIFAVPSNTSMPAMQLQPQRFMEAVDDDIDPGPRKVVLSNQYQAIAIYTKFVDNPSLWDPQFMMAFENALGVRLVIPLSGDKKMAEAARLEAREVVLAARVSDGNEGLTFGPSVQQVPDWLAVRGYSADMTTPGYLQGGFYNPSFLLL